MKIFNFKESTQLYITDVKNIYNNYLILKELGIRIYLKKDEVYLVKKNIKVDRYGVENNGYYNLYYNTNSDTYIITIVNNDIYEKVILMDINLNIEIIEVEDTFIDFIIDTYRPKGRFYNKSGIFIDNITGDAWTEEFKKKEIGLKWLKDKLDTEDAYKLDNLE